MNAYRRVVMYQALSLYNGILEYASKCLNPFQNCDFGLGGEKERAEDPVHRHPEESIELIRLHSKIFYTNYKIIYN